LVILSPLKIEIERFFSLGALLGLGIVVLSAISLAFFLIFSPGKLDLQGAQKRAMDLKPHSSFALEAIGTGGTTLNPKMAYGWASRVADDFTVLAYNSRPDVAKREASLLVSLGRGREQRVIPNGKAFFLQERAEGKGLMFSEEQTSLQVQPVLLDNGNILVEVVRKLISKEGQLVREEKSEYYTLPKGMHAMEKGSFVEELKTVRCLGSDMLIQKYGGSEFATWRDKIKIEFKKGSQNYACFVSSGDHLQYCDGEWRVVSLEKASRDLPLAYVKSATMRGVELQGWDDSGFFPLEIDVAAEQVVPLTVKLDAVPSALHLRSPTQVSCALGKKRMILKKGDWLLKTSIGWRRLSRKDELEACLYHRLKGELLIFDGIVKQQGQLVLSGHLFDENRTNVQPLSLLIESGKKADKSLKKRRHA